MKSKSLCVLLTVLSFAIIGCAEETTEYEQKVELTAEQQAKEKENMAGQQAPGAITPGQPVDKLQAPPGKSGN